MRGSLRYLSWIERCGETINNFLNNSRIDSEAISVCLRKEEKNIESNNSPHLYSRSEQKKSLKLKAKENVVEQKINNMVMGKLNEVKRDSEQILPF